MPGTPPAERRAVEQVDCIVVGAGVVGLAAARALALAGDEVLVAEAAGGIGTGISSRNSEVIHAGIHYPPGSLKARLCVAGRDALYAYCAERGIGHRRLGKLIVATTQREVGELERLKSRARANGVDDLAWMSGGEVLGLEPELRCLRALLSPGTGIVDSHAFMLALQADLEGAGGTVAFNAAVTGARALPDGFEVDVAGAPALRCRRLVNAAGLAATTLARAIEGLAATQVPRLWLAAGQYFSLAGPAPFRRLVYPVPGAAGLGIHFTLDLGGRARFGPDARWVERVDFRPDATLRDAFAEAIRRYYPGLEPERLEPACVGVRPKLAGPGEPAADFVIQGPAAHGLPGLVNLFGIESPGLTASLAIGDCVAGELRDGPSA